MLELGTLWARIIEQTKHGLQCGALQPVPTEFEFIEQNGTRFLVRILSNLDRKQKAKQDQDQATASSGKEFNPFLPYDEDLFVTDLSDTHVCLLNKFNVIDYHLLMVTRSFEEQDTWLTLQDFEAMWICLAEIDGLAFYNGSEVAGASQRHKHLQLVPLPLTPTGPRLPIEPILASATQGLIGTVPSLPFVHAVAGLDAYRANSPLESARATLKCYYRLLHAVGLDAPEGGQTHPGAYNLLVTRQWMLLVPRTQEHFESISVNSLGFAGALLVQNKAQMKLLQDYSPMAVLRSVAIPT